MALALGTTVVAITHLPASASAPAYQAGWFAFGGVSGSYVAVVRTAGGRMAIATSSDAEPTVHLYDPTVHEYGYVPVLFGFLRGARVAAARVEAASPESDPDQLLVGGGPGTPGVAVVERTNRSLYRPALPG